MTWTILGKQKMFEEFFCSGAIDDTFRLVLCDGNYGTWNVSTVNTANVSAVSSLNNAANDEGGTSGLIVLRDDSSNGLHFDVSAASSLDGSAVQAVLQVGPSATTTTYQFSGIITDARYIVLAAAGSQGSAFDFVAGKDIYAWWDIGSNTSVPQGSTLTIAALSLQGN